MKIISNIIERLPAGLKKFLTVDSGDKAGLYLTVICHLVLLIILLSWSIHAQLRKDTLNTSRNQNARSVRNVAVDASEPLRDDRHDNPEDIYRDARELQERLDRTRREIEEASDDEDNIAVSDGKSDKAKKETYTGPSVISYTLDGRKAMNLPVPAYKCMGGGDVSVSIIVNRKGYVVGTKIIESVSSPDQCLRDYALRAAGRSRFTASQDAPERQAGEIVYRFIAQ